MMGQGFAEESGKGLVRMAVVGGVIILLVGVAIGWLLG
jgi:hypothetical protein